MAKWHYERLSSQDNSFLLWEKGNVRMHVASTNIFDAGPLRQESGGIDIDLVRDIHLEQLVVFRHIFGRALEMHQHLQHGSGDAFCQVDHLAPLAVPTSGRIQATKTLQVGKVADAPQSHANRPDSS